MTARIDPERGGYAFGNRFVDVLVRLPNGATVRTAGRCGGMTFSVLDHRAAGRDVPSWPATLFAPGHVPPDGHLVADHLRARQLDSFRSVSALRFLTWCVLPDDDRGPLAGVRTRTRRALPGVLRALAEGRPVPLGMVVARNVLRAGDNHQVVATGFARGASGAVTLTLLDPNTPHREVTLVEVPDGWRASNGQLWRGFFPHTYVPRAAPALPSASRRPSARVRPDAPLPLAHVATGRLLVVEGGRPALRASGATTWRPTVEVPDGALRDGSVVRLVTDGARPAAPDALVLDAGSPTLAPGPSAPGAEPGTGAADAWRVVVDGGGAWREGSRVRLVHTTTGALLAAAGTALGTTFTPDASTWWTAAAS